MTTEDIVCQLDDVMSGMHRDMLDIVQAAQMPCEVRDEDTADSPNRPSVNGLIRQFESAAGGKTTASREESPCDSRDTSHCTVTHISTSSAHIEHVNTPATCATTDTCPAAQSNHITNDTEVDRTNYDPSLDGVTLLETLHNHSECQDISVDTPDVQDTTDTENETLTFREAACGNCDINDPCNTLATNCPSPTLGDASEHVTSAPDPRSTIMDPPKPPVCDIPRDSSPAPSPSPSDSPVPVYLDHNANSKPAEGVCPVIPDCFNVPPTSLLKKQMPTLDTIHEIKCLTPTDTGLKGHFDFELGADKLNEPVPSRLSLENNHMQTIAPTDMLDNKTTVDENKTHDADNNGLDNLIDEKDTRQDTSPDISHKDNVTTTDISTQSTCDSIPKIVITKAENGKLSSPPPDDPKHKPSHSPTSDVSCDKDPAEKEEQEERESSPQPSPQSRRGSRSNSLLPPSLWSIQSPYHSRRRLSTCTPEPAPQLQVHGPEEEWTEQRTLAINGALDWIKTQLHEMRCEDQELARTLLELRHGIREVKLQRCCDENREALDDAMDDVEEDDQHQLLTDFVPGPLSPVLKDIGLTKMNITIRRFSVF